MSHVTRLTPASPHAVDFVFRCRIHDAEKFGTRGYAVFFWANYLRTLSDEAIHIRGVESPWDPEHWVRTGTVRGGGTYRASNAPSLDYDADHNMTINLKSFEYPRLKQPVFYCRAADKMVLTVMLDRLYSETEEVRFSHFAPAFDIQYVLRRLQSGQRRELKGRLVWKPWVDAEDCLQEFRRWRRSPGGPGERDGKT